MKSALRPPPSAIVVPAGFSGWWCQRCEQACPGIPEDLDAAQAKCPHCHHWTARWVPPGAAIADCRLQIADSARRPRGPRAAALFAHMRAVLDHPELNPDLRALEHEETIR